MSETSLIRLDTPQAKSSYTRLEEIYLASFEPCERVPFSALWESQYRPEPGKFIPEMVGLLVDGEAVGGAWYGYMPDANLGYLGYLFIDTHLRSRGWGSFLFEQVYQSVTQLAGRIKGKLPRFLFWEVRIPEEAEDPVEYQHRIRRIEFYKKQGATPVQVDYPCPPIAAGQPALNFLPMAVTFPVGRILSVTDREDLVYYGLVRMNGLDPSSLEYERALASARRAP